MVMRKYGGVNPDSAFDQRQNDGNEEGRRDAAGNVWTTWLVLRSKRVKINTRKTNVCKCWVRNYSAEKCGNLLTDALDSVVDLVENSCVHLASDLLGGDRILQLISGVFLQEIGLLLNVDDRCASKSSNSR